MEGEQLWLSASAELMNYALCVPTLKLAVSDLGKAAQLGSIMKINLNASSRRRWQSAAEQEGGTRADLCSLFVATRLETLLPAASLPLHTSPLEAYK